LTFATNACFSFARIIPSRLLTLFWARYLASHGQHRVSIHSRYTAKHSETSRSQKEAMDPELFVLRRTRRKPAKPIDS
jgi:hypothetical protein